MEVLREFLPPGGRRIADIGCGDGSLVRAMARLGAAVTGIECSDGQLARAGAPEPARDEDYRFAYAEDLPFEDGELDAAVLFNSLHHVAVEAQTQALSEAARALKPGGLLYIVEPIAEGSNFELVRPVDDETVVRAKAYEAIQAAAQGGDFEQIREYRYVTPVVYADFAAFKERMIAVDEKRRAAVEAKEAELRRDFEARAERRDGAYIFAQPCRLNLLARR